MDSYRLPCNYPQRALWCVYCGIVMSLFWYVAVLNLQGIPSFSTTPGSLFAFMAREAVREQTQILTRVFPKRIDFCCASYYSSP